MEKKPGSQETIEPTHPFWPGSRLPVKKRQEMILEARLTSQAPVEAFELIHNGEVVRKVTVDPQLGEHILGQAPMDRPGWFVVRAVAELEHKYRFTSTAPFYIINSREDIPIHKEVCRFFLNWCYQRMERIDLDEGPQREEVMLQWKQAVKWWEKRLQLKGYVVPEK